MGSKRAESWTRHVHIINGLTDHEILRFGIFVRIPVIRSPIRLPSSQRPDAIRAVPVLIRGIFSLLTTRI